MSYVLRKLLECYQNLSIRCIVSNKKWFLHNNNKFSVSQLSRTINIYIYCTVYTLHMVYLLRSNIWYLITSIFQHSTTTVKLCFWRTSLYYYYYYYNSDTRQTSPRPCSAAGRVVHRRHCYYYHIIVSCPSFVRTFVADMYFCWCHQNRKFRW